MKRIIVGSDHAGFALKEKIKIYLKKKNFLVKDLGTYSA
jgi:ribose 5-phosphate isomerase B